MSVTPTYDRERPRRVAPRALPAAFAATLWLVTCGTLSAEHKVFGFGESMFFSFRQTSTEIRPDFDIRTWATALEKALGAYRAGEFAEAHRLFKVAADDGDPMAHWWLGRMYRLGQGVPASDAEAFRHFRQAALAFDGLERPGPLMGAKLDSLVHVGRYYRRGVPDADIEPQPQRALRIFRTAAEFKHPGAQYGIGAMLYDGEGLTKRPWRGMRWLMLSAQKHFPPALAKLGEIYREKRERPFNEVSAMMWYILARNAARPEIHPEIVDRYDELAATLPAEKREQARQMALNWNRRFPPPATHRLLQRPVAETGSRQTD